MIMPLSDENDPHAGPAIVTWGLIAANVLVFFLELGLGEPFINGYSAVPKEIMTGKDIDGPIPITVTDEDGKQVVESLNHSPGPPLIYLTLLTSMFMHGGWMHLLGNMLYLWIFGDNIEHKMGRVKFLVFYLLCGLAATAAHIASDVNSIIPSLGASGAISGVLGAYLVSFPKNNIHVLIPRVGIIPLPAVLVIGLWFLMQLLSGIASIQEVGGGVAWWAHIGGFVAGMGLVFVFGGEKTYTPTSGSRFT